MSFRNSFGKTKRNATEAESTWQREHKRIKTSIYNKVLFYTEKNLHETQYYECSMRNECEILVVSSSVKSIPEDAFWAFPNLHSVIFKHTSLLEEIESHAFFGCKSLKHITLPPSLKTIGKCAFGLCELLRCMIIPSSVRLIGKSAFEACSNLTHILFEDRSLMEQIGMTAFYDCCALEDFTLPSTVATISRGTFGCCSRLKQIIIPPSVKVIGDGAFENCHSLQSMILPTTLEWFGNHVIHNCNELWTLHVSSMDNGILGWDRDISRHDFCNLDSELILLCNSTGLPRHMEHWQPIMVLHDIANTCGYINHHAYTRIHGMENELNKDEQNESLRRVFKEFFPDAAYPASIHQLNLLHILCQFPCADNDVTVDCAGGICPTRDIVLDAMKDLLRKYPAAAMSMDKYGRTPIHHLFELNPRRHDSVVELLMSYCDDSILHKAIQSKYPCFAVIENIVSVIPALLSITDEQDTQLFPFMTAAMGGSMSDLTTAYKLLLMKPDILLH